MASIIQEERNVFHGQQDKEINDVKEQKMSLENVAFTLKRKINLKEERRPNIPVRRKTNVTVQQENVVNSSNSPEEVKLRNHLKAQIIVRREDEDEKGMPPQAQMEAIVPAPERFGIDLTPTLQNVVCTVNMGCTLDLQRITFCTRMSEYNPSRFSGVVMRIREPHTTALIFRSGKMVVTGAKTEGEAHLASRKFARIIQKLGFSVTFTDFKIQNIVGTFDLKFPIRVENLNQVHGQFCRYEPELFPGLIYRLVKPRVVLLIFVNGKVVMTGARNRAELKEALKIMYPVLKSFKKEKCQ